MTTYEIDIPAAHGTSPTRFGGRLAAAALPFLRPTITALVGMVRGPLVDFDDDLDPQYLRSFVHIGFCVNCDKSRILTPKGDCENCFSQSILPRKTNERRTHGKEQEGSPDAHEGRREKEGLLTQ